MKAEEQVEHWKFVNWTNEDGEQISDTPEFGSTMLSRDHTLTANFSVGDAGEVIIANDTVFAAGTTYT